MPNLFGGDPQQPVVVPRTLNANEDLVHYEVLRRDGGYVCEAEDTTGRRQIADPTPKLRGYIERCRAMEGAPASWVRADDAEQSIGSEIGILNALCGAVHSYFIARTKPDGFAEGQIGNCRWRLFGPECDSRAKGELHLADASKFDCWANSKSVVVEIWSVVFEKGDVRQIVERAVAIYRTPPAGA